MTPDQFADTFVDAHADELGALEASVELSAEDGGVVIEGLMVRHRRREGRGSRALRILCSAADAAGVPLEVSPQPLTLIVHDPIPLAKLCNFYSGFGFEEPGRAGERWLRPLR